MTIVYVVYEWLNHNSLPCNLLAGFLTCLTSRLWGFLLSRVLRAGVYR
jgi:hypothetical protein